MSGGKRKEEVERVFDSICTQREVFETVKPFISQCAEGFNVTIFAYGQTGSGKTYTMFGNDWNNILKAHTSEKSKQSTFLHSLEQDENYAGLIPRAINHIFTNVIVKRRKYIKVFCSFLQLYNENMLDLFEDTKIKTEKKMLIHENKNDGIYVEGLSEIEVNDVDHCLELMQKGEKNRIVRQTHMNVKSSRSHTLFQLLIEEVFPSSKSYRRVKVNLCDLAGSEKINKTEKMEQEHFDELKNINLSLTTLGKVISSLSEKSKKPPYRESKLTRLLQDSLGGNTYTAIIAGVTSKSSCLEESLNTLNFLERAKQIKVSVSNKIHNENPDMRNLEKEIAYLKDVLKMKRTGVEVDVNMADKVKKLQSENYRLKEMVNEELVEKLLKENTNLKRELNKKSTDQMIDSGTKFTTIDYDSIKDREQSAVEKAEVSSIWTANKIGSTEKDKKLMSTKTYTTSKQDKNKTNKSSNKIFPTIRNTATKYTPSSILDRIHEIERVKQANKLKLEHQLSLIGLTQSYEKKKEVVSISKYGSSRYKE